MYTKESGAISSHSHEVTMEDQTSTIITHYPRRPKPSPYPVFLILPALGVRATFYSPLATQLAHAGADVVTMDWRGNGNSTVRPSRKADFGFHEILTIDLPGIVKAVRDRFPQKPLYVMGHSLGGQLALLYGSLFPGQVDGYVLLTAGSNHYHNLKIPHRYYRYFNYQLIRFFTFLFGYFPGDRLGFAGREAKTMIWDWLQESLTGRYAIRRNLTDFNALLPKIERSVLFITLKGDHFVTANCARFLSNKLKAARITRVELNAADYQLQPFTHFNWRKTPQPIVATIMRWLTNGEVLPETKPAASELNG